MLGDHSLSKSSMLIHLSWQVRGEVPESVRTSRSEFYRCGCCRQIFWGGEKCESSPPSCLRTLRCTTVLRRRTCLGCLDASHGNHFTRCQCLGTALPSITIVPAVLTGGVLLLAADDDTMDKLKALSVT